MALQKFCEVGNAFVSSLGLKDTQTALVKNAVYKQTFKALQGTVK